MTRWAWAACGLVLLSRLIAWGLAPHATEDAMITFRVAHNWLSSGFPSYNVGEHVGSVTSLPWTAWVTLGMWLGFDPVLWTRLTALACDAAVLSLVSRETLVPFCLLYALPIFSYASVSGLEMTAVTAALVATTRFPWANAVLAALRPEGLLAATVVAVFRRGWWLTGPLAGLGVLGVSWMLWGDPTPTLTVKRLVYGVHWFAGWFWLSPLMPVDLGGSPMGIAEHVDSLRLLAVPAAAMGLVAGGAALLAPCAVVLAAYFVTGTSGFWWYIVPWLAGYFAVTAQGVSLLAMPRIVTATAVCVCLSLWWPGFQALRRHVASEVPIRQAAEYLKAQNATGTIFLEPIGYVGWLNPQLRVIDEVGLATPWVARRRTGEPGWWGDIVDKEKPDWIVTRMEFINNPHRAWAGIGVPVVEGNQPLASYEGRVAFDRVLVVRRVTKP